MEIIALVMVGAFFLLSIFFLITMQKNRQLSDTIDRIKDYTELERIHNLEIENKVQERQLEAVEKFNQELMQKTTMLEKLNHDLEREKLSLADKLEETEKLHQTKEEFFTAVIHDIKSPANAIKNIAELLNNYEMNAQEQKEIIDRLFSTSDKIIKYSTDIGKMLADEASPYKPVFAMVGIQDFLSKVIEEHKPKAEKKKQTLELEVKPNIPEVEMDREKIAEALDNLIDNAIKFSPFEKPVKVSAKKKDKALYIEVTDEGPGIDSDELSRAFDKGTRLSTVPTAGETQTGLGLWIVKKIVQEHKGNAFVKSRRGKGSTFGLRLPFKQSIDLPEEN